MRATNQSTTSCGWITKMNDYILDVITPPPVEPVTLTEVKLHLRVTSVDLDATISGYIKSAREYVESFLDRSIISQTLKITLPYFCDDLVLPRGMVRSIANVVYYNSSNVLTGLTIADYANLISSNVSANRLQRKPYVSWPLPIARRDAVQITYVAGYAPTTSSDPDYVVNVPEEIKTAIKFLVQSDYDDLMADDKAAVMRHVHAKLSMLKLNW